MNLRRLLRFVIIARGGPAGEPGVFRTKKLREAHEVIVATGPRISHASATSGDSGGETAVRRVVPDRASFDPRAVFMHLGLWPAL